MAEQDREAGAEAEAGSRQEEGDKEAEPSWKGRRALNLSFSGRGKTFLPWREKESENFALLSIFLLFLTIR